MVENARQKHIALLKVQLAQEESNLNDKQTLLGQLQAEVAQLQDNVDYYKQMLAQIAPDEAEPISMAMNANGKVATKVADHSSLYPPLAEEELLEEDEDEEYGKNTGGEDENKRNPKQMLRPGYEGMTLAEVAEKFLQARQWPIEADEIAKVIFEALDDDEYRRAKNSLSTELRRGAKQGKWRKVGRGSFMPNKNARTIETSSAKSWDS